MFTFHTFPTVIAESELPHPIFPPPLPSPPLPSSVCLSVCLSPSLTWRNQGRWRSRYVIAQAQHPPVPMPSRAFLQALPIFKALRLCKNRGVTFLPLPLFLALSRAYTWTADGYYLPQIKVWIFETQNKRGRGRWPIHILCPSTVVRPLTQWHRPVGGGGVMVVSQASHKGQCSLWKVRERAVVSAEGSFLGRRWIALRMIRSPTTVQ